MMHLRPATLRTLRDEWPALMWLSVGWGLRHADGALLTVHVHRLDGGAWAACVCIGGLRGMVVRPTPRAAVRALRYDLDGQLAALAEQHAQACGRSPAWHEWVRQCAVLARELAP
jgi:hypothetical protein